MEENAIGMPDSFFERLNKKNGFADDTTAAPVDSGTTPVATDKTIPSGMPDSFFEKLNSQQHYADTNNWAENYKRYIPQAEENPSAWDNIKNNFFAIKDASEASMYGGLELMSRQGEKSGNANFANFIKAAGMYYGADPNWLVKNMQENEAQSQEELKRVWLDPKMGQFNATDMFADPKSFFQTQLPQMLGGSATLMAAGMGIAKGVQTGVMALGAAGAPFTFGGSAVAAGFIGGAVASAISRPIESLMEGYGAFDEAYSELAKKYPNATHQQLTDMAMPVFNKTFDENMQLQVLDAVQLGLSIIPVTAWGKGALSGTGAIGRMARRADMMRQRYNVAAHIGETAFQMGTEGWEEGRQMQITNEAINKYVGTDKPTSWYDMLNTKEGQSAVSGGAFMGGMMESPGILKLAYNKLTGVGDDIKTKPYEDIKQKQTALFYGNIAKSVNEGTTNEMMQAINKFGRSGVLATVETDDADSRNKSSIAEAKRLGDEVAEQVGVFSRMKEQYPDVSEKGLVRMFQNNALIRNNANALKTLSEDNVTDAPIIQRINAQNEALNKENNDIIAGKDVWETPSHEDPFADPEKDKEADIPFDSVEEVEAARLKEIEALQQIPTDGMTDEQMHQRAESLAEINSRYEDLKNRLTEKINDAKGHYENQRVLTEMLQNNIPVEGTIQKAYGMHYDFVTQDGKTVRFYNQATHDVVDDNDFNGSAFLVLRKAEQGLDGTYKDEKGNYLFRSVLGDKDHAERIEVHTTDKDGNDKYLGNVAVSNAEDYNIARDRAKAARMEKLEGEDGEGEGFSVSDEQLSGVKTTSNEQAAEAQSYGFRNAYHALNSVNKYFDADYTDYANIPKEDLALVGRIKQEEAASATTTTPPPDSPPPSEPDTPPAPPTPPPTPPPAPKSPSPANAPSGTTSSTDSGNAGYERTERSFDKVNVGDNITHNGKQGKVFAKVRPKGSLSHPVVLAKDAEGVVFRVSESEYKGTERGESDNVLKTNGKLLSYRNDIGRIVVDEENNVIFEGNKSSVELGKTTDEEFAAKSIGDIGISYVNENSLDQAILVDNTVYIKGEQQELVRINYDKNDNVVSYTYKNSKGHERTNRNSETALDIAIQKNNQEFDKSRKGVSDEVKQRDEEHISGVVKSEYGDSIGYILETMPDEVYDTFDLMESGVTRIEKDAVQDMVLRTLDALDNVKKKIADSGATKKEKGNALSMIEKFEKDLNKYYGKLDQQGKVSAKDVAKANTRENNKGDGAVQTAEQEAETIATAQEAQAQNPIIAENDKQQQGTESAVQQSPDATGQIEAGTGNAVQVKSFKKGDGGTLGVFEGNDGKLYKSVQPTELVQNSETKVYERKPIPDTETEEYQILSELQDNPHVPKVGKIVQTSEGKAFEMEKLDEVESISKEQYRQVQSILNDLNDKGYHVGDRVSVMQRPKTKELVIVDFSHGYKGSRMSRDADDYMMDVANKLSKSDQVDIEQEDWAVAMRDFAEGFNDIPNQYFLTQRPPSIGTHPTDGLINMEEVEFKGRKAWKLTYDRTLKQDEIYNFELYPNVTNKEFFGQKISGVFGKKPFYVKNIDDKNGVVEMISESDGKEIEIKRTFREFQKNISEGKYKIESKNQQPSKQADAGTGNAVQSVETNPALRAVESTAKALEGVDTQSLKKQLDIEANWDMIGEGDALSGKDAVLAYTQKQLPEWNRESQLGNINPNSKLTYDIVRGQYGGLDQKNIAEAKDENGVTIAIAKLDDKGGVEHIAVAPEFRGKGVADNLIKVLKENNPNLDLSKTKLRSKGFEKAFGNKIISEAYHKAKADGSNPELVKAVEDLIAPKVAPTTNTEGETQTTEAQLQEFGVPEQDVKPVTNVLTAMVDGLRKAGLIAAKTVGEFVGIGKGKKTDSSLKHIIGERGAEGSFEEKYGVTFEQVEKLFESDYKNIYSGLERTFEELGVQQENLGNAIGDFMAEKVSRDLPSKLPNKKEKWDKDDLPRDRSLNVKPIPTKVKKVDLKTQQGKIEALKPITSKDDLRPNMQGVFHDADKKVLVATDAHKMVVIKDPTIKKTFIQDVTGKVVGLGKEIDAKYPDYSVVIPESAPIKQKVNVQQMLDETAGLARASDFFVDKDHLGIAAKITIGDKEFFFNPRLFNEVLTVFAQQGDKEVELQLSKPNRALKIESGDVTAILMPVQGYDQTLDNSVPHKEIFRRDETVDEKRKAIQNEIEYLEKNIKEAEGKLKLANDAFRKADASNYKSLEWDKNYEQRKYEEAKAALEEKKSELLGISNPIQEQSDKEIIKKAINNGEITEQEASNFIESANTDEVESVIEAIESKAESETEVELNEVVEEVDDAVKGKVKPKPKKTGISANAQYRVESGKRLIEALKDFSKAKNKRQATTAIIHEIMHPTVETIITGAKEGNAVGQKHTKTIVEEYNKANPDNKVTEEELIADNDKFVNGETTDKYRAVQEFIAEQWERYHQEGAKGFSKSFQEVLDAISEAFKSVYNSLVGKELTPELRKMFDEILGKQQPTESTPTKEVSTSENKIKSWIDKWEELKKENDNEQLDLFYNKVKVALNGYAQGKGVVDEFTKLKSEIEQFAKERKAKPKEQGNKERVSSNSNEGNSALRDVGGRTNTINGFKFTDTPSLSDKDGLQVTPLPKEDANIIKQQMFVSEKMNSAKEGVSNEGGGWYSSDTGYSGNKVLYNVHTGEAVELGHKKGGRMGGIISDFILNNERKPNTNETTPTKEGVSSNVGTFSGESNSIKYQIEEFRDEPLSSVNPALAEYIRQRMQRLFPSVALFSDKASFEAAAKKVSKGVTFSSAYIGAAIKNMVYVDAEKALQHTEIHEYAHIYWDALPADHPLKTALLDKFGGNEEAAIDAIGRAGTIIMENELDIAKSGFFEKWLKKFWAAVKGVFTSKSIEQAFAERLLTNADEVTEENITSGVVKYMKMKSSAKYSELSEKAVKGIEKIIGKKISSLTFPEYYKHISTEIKPNDFKQWKMLSPQKFLEKMYGIVSPVSTLSPSNKAVFMKQYREYLDDYNWAENNVWTRFASGSMTLTVKEIEDLYMEAYKRKSYGTKDAVNFLADLYSKAVMYKNMQQEIKGDTFNKPFAKMSFDMMSGHEITDLSGSEFVSGKYSLLSPDRVKETILQGREKLYREVQRNATIKEDALKNDFDAIWKKVKDLKSDLHKIVDKTGKYFIDRNSSAYKALRSGTVADRALADLLDMHYKYESAYGGLSMEKGKYRVPVARMDFGGLAKKFGFKEGMRRYFAKPSKYDNVIIDVRSLGLSKPLMTLKQARQEMVKGSNAIYPFQMLKLTKKVDALTKEAYKQFNSGRHANGDIVTTEDLSGSRYGVSFVKDDESSEDLKVSMMLYHYANIENESYDLLSPYSMYIQKYLGRKDKPNMLKWVKMLDDDLIKGESPTSNLGVYAKYVQALTNYTHWLQLGFNIAGMPFNAFAGFAQSVREIGFRNTLRGLRRVIGSLTVGGGAGVVNAKAISIMEKLHIVSLSKDLEMSVTSKIGKGISKIAFLPVSFVEYINHAYSFIGAMDESEWERVKALPANASAEDYTKAMGGNERVDELHTLTQKINGAYSKYSRRGINKTAEGRALMQFKNWLPDVIFAHLTVSQLNEAGEDLYGEYQSGIATSVKNTVWNKTIIPMFKDKSIAQAKKNWETLSEHEQMQVGKAMRQLVILGGMALWIASLDDRDDKELKRMLKRAMGDVTYIFDVSNMQFLFDNTVPVFGTIKNLLGLVAEVFSTATGNPSVYEKRQGSHKRGDLKLPVMIENQAPVVNKISKLVNEKD